MSVDNFIYDNISLKSKGYIVVHFDGGQDGEITTDSQFTYNHISLMNGKRQPFITSTYEDPLIIEWWIMANPCETIIDEETGEEREVLRDDGYNITVEQMADLKRWLVRPTVHELRIPTTEYEGIYWKGSFNVEEYVLGDKRIGAHLTFECNAPYGYYNPILMEGTLEANEVLTFNDVSDEIGYICPYVHIKMLADGDLQITDRDGRVTEMKDCATGELIHFTRYLTVNRSNEAKNRRIGDYFNFVYYRISNTFGNRVNTFSCNLPVEYQIVYRPIAKVVPV